MHPLAKLLRVCVVALVLSCVAEVLAPGGTFFVRFLCLLGMWNLFGGNWMLGRPVDWRRYFLTTEEILYPEYECEDCLGIGLEHGCYCSHYACWAPGDLDGPWWRKGAILYGPDSWYKVIDPRKELR